MPRDVGTGAYYYPSGTPGNPNQTIFSTRYNTFLDDLTNTLNTPLPINMGGTGSTVITDIPKNIGAEVAGKQVTDYSTHAFYPGSFYSLSSANDEPVNGHAFAGICYGISDTVTPANTKLVLEARDLDDASTPGKVYVREKLGAAAWGAWTVIDATTVPFPPGGGISSTTILTAIQELDNDKVNRIGDTMSGALTVNGGAITANAGLSVAGTATINVVNVNSGNLTVSPGSVTVNGSVSAGGQVQGQGFNLLAGGAAQNGMTLIAPDTVNIVSGGNVWFRGSKDGGQGRVSAFTAEFITYTPYNGLCMRGSGNSGVISILDFSNFGLVQCGSIDMDMGNHTVAYGSASDIRGKANRAAITPVEGRAVIDALQVWDFDKDGNDIRGYGVIAQQAYAVHKSLAMKPKKEGDWWMTEKAAPVPFLIAALQGANQMIDKLEARLAKLEAKLAEKPA